MAAKIHRLKLPAVKPAGNELLSVIEFARRVGRHRNTVYGWLDKHEMPEGSVVMVHGSLRIDWQAYQSQLKVVM